MPTVTVVDALLLARRCRALIKSQKMLVTSCIESAFLFERTAFHLGLPASRVVCQATAMTAKLAEAIEDGRETANLMDEPGYWAVGVGHLQFPDDFVGRSDTARNRYVGHVVCLVDGHLVDVSVDQMHRPEKHLVLNEPLIVEYAGGPVVIGVGSHGSVVRYALHPDVPVPAPRSNKILERLAKGLAVEWASNQHISGITRSHPRPVGEKTER